MFVGLKRLHIHIPPSPISQSLLPLTSFPSKRGQRSIFEGGGGEKKFLGASRASKFHTHFQKSWIRPSTHRYQYRFNTWVLIARLPYEPYCVSIALLVVGWLVCLSLFPTIWWEVTHQCSYRSTCSCWGLNSRSTMANSWSDITYTSFRKK